MVTQTSSPFDFVAATNGHCFLCSDKISSWGHSHPTRSESSSIYALHCLSRYLKMDMKKVFNEEGPLPPHLVTRVEKSKLKAELCQECASLTKAFSGQLMQLEKIRMEVTSGLSLIQQKLERALKGGVGGATGKTDDWEAKMKITESLRMEAMQKCSRKLSTVRPVAKLQRLTREQVNAEKLKIKLYSVKAESSIQYSHPQSNHDDDPAMEMESPASPPISNADGMDYLEEPNPSLEALIDDPNYGIRNEAVKQEVQTSQYQDEPYYEDEVLTGEQVSEQKHPTPSRNTVNINAAPQNRRTTVKDKVKKLSEAMAIPPPIKVIGDVGVEKPDVHRDAQTGKYKCSICTREFSLKSHFQPHFDSAHLKVRHKCGLCGKDFTLQKDYERHYMNIHMGVRFKCGKCDRTFSRKDGLIQHQKRNHLGE